MTKNLSKYFLVLSVCFSFLFLSIGHPITAEKLIEDHYKDNRLNVQDANVESLNETEFYAIVCCCSEYINPDNNLPPSPKEPFPQNKVDYIYQALLKSDNWNKENIIFLFNQQATRQNIINALNEMAGRVDSNDIFLFAWAGHGSEVRDEDGDESTSDPNDLYDEVICPYDCERKHGQLINYISDDELDGLFSNISAKGICLIFEACLSGGLVSRDYSDTDAEAYTKSFTQDVQQNRNTIDVEGLNRVVLMSSHPNSLCRVSYIFGFIFTASIALALRGLVRDRIHDGFISAEEVFNSAQYLYMGFSSLHWLSIGLIYYFRFALPGPGGIIGLIFKDCPPVIQAFIKLVVYRYILIRNTGTGHICLNYPNMADNYTGDLPLIIEK